MEFPDQFGLALGRMAGQFKAEGAEIMVSDGEIVRVPPVPVAQHAFPDVTIADENHSAFLVAERIDARFIGCLELDPGFCPGVMVARGFQHAMPSEGSQRKWLSVKACNHRSTEMATVALVPTPHLWRHSQRDDVRLQTLFGVFRVTPFDLNRVLPRLVQIVFLG